MPPLPKTFSVRAQPITAAISEGRAEDALHMLAHALREYDDRAIRHLAAEWIETIGLPPGAAKALRKGRKELPDEWLDIAGMVSTFQSEGRTYDDAVERTANQLNYSVRHVQRCVALWNLAEEMQREHE